MEPKPLNQSTALEIYDRPMYEVDAAPSHLEETPTIFHYLEALWRRKYLFFSILIICLGLGVGYAKTRKKMYSATTSIIVVARGDEGGPNVNDAGVTNLDAQVNLMTQPRNQETQVQLISGAAVMNAAFNSLPDDVKKSGFGWNGVSKEAPAGAVKAEAQKETDIINITATAATPDAAVAMANATAQAYFDTDMNQKISEVKRVEKTVNSELITQRDRYNDALASLAAFQRSSNLIDLETMQHSFSQSWLDARTQIDMKESQLGAAQNAANDIRRRLLSTPATLPGTTQTSRNPEYEAAYGQLLTYRKDLDDARRQYTPESDTVRRAQKAVDDQQKIVDSLPRTVTNTTESVRNPQADQLRNDLNAQLTLSASLQREIGKDRETLSARASDVKNFPEKQRQYAVLKEKVDVNYQTYSTLAAQSNKLAVAEVTAQPTGHIGALATPPSKPSAPNVPILIGAAAFIGLMLGIVAVSIAETADKRLRDPMFAEKSYGIPTLSTIPYVQGLRAGTRMPIIGEVPGSAAFLEGFRYLRNNILFSMPNRRMKLLAITSPSPADGKSTVSLNLAVAMGMDGKRVLVVDVDLRRPSLHHFANAANDKGFTTLVDGATLADCVVGTPYRNVHVLPSGPLPVDPTEFLNSSRCREAIAKLSTAYDIVILDSPPCVGLSDVQIIGTVADSVLMVVSMESTTEESLKASVRQLRQAGAPLIGVAVNKVTKKGANGTPFYFVDYTDALPQRTA